MFTTLLIINNFFVEANKPLSLKDINFINKKFSTFDEKLIKLNTSSNLTTIRGISIGGWLVTEPYITPTLYKNAIAIGANMTVDPRGNDTQISNFTFGSGSGSISPTFSTLKNISIVDEFTLCEKLGYGRSSELLEEHFNTWITEDDFKQIAENKFNLVRIPIGYWAWKLNNSLCTYPGNLTYRDPYIGEGLQFKYLDKAMQWASKYGLKVWIDLHGAPGSQNGFDNSGQRNFYYDLGWLADTQTKALTIRIWKDMFHGLLSKYDNIIGLEIINEPLVPKISLWDVTQSYYEAFDMFKEIPSKVDDPAFIIHDAFQSIGHWNLDFNPSYKNVSNQYYNLTNISYSAETIWVDHHHYEVFTDSQAQENQYDRIMNIINYGKSISDELEHHPAIVGEWSGAITDCATWVNGVDVGARYDGSYYNTTLFTTTADLNGVCQSQNEISQWTEDYRISVRQFIEAQLATYESQTNGWIFWNWKTENAPEWDYLKLKEANLFPTPFNNYTYFQTNGTIDNKFSSSLSKSVFESLSTQSASYSKTKNMGVSQHQKIFVKQFNDRTNNLHMGWKITLSILTISISAVCIFL